MIRIVVTIIITILLSSVLWVVEPNNFRLLLCAKFHTPREDIILLYVRDYNDYNAIYCIKLWHVAWETPAIIL